MSRISARVLGPLAVMLALAALPSTAFGQATRTWVSGVGDDVNPCSRTAPCKTFAGAISKTAAKGEINVLDPGGFGGVTITKSIHIRARGFTAGVLVSGTNAIVISAGSSDRVTLTGLDINGLDTGINGVKVNSAKVVRIEKCDVFGFSNSGVNFTPSNANARLIIQDSHISDNVAGTGVGVQPTAAGGAVTIRRSEIDDNANGIAVNGTSQPAIVNLFRSEVADNASFGLLAIGTQADIRIGSNDITGNGTGLSTSSAGKITSYGNNHVNGNGSDGNPTSTIATR